MDKQRKTSVWTRLKAGLLVICLLLSTTMESLPISAVSNLLDGAGEIIQPNEGLYNQDQLLTDGETLPADSTLSYRLKMDKTALEEGFVVELPEALLFLEGQEVLFQQKDGTTLTLDNTLEDGQLFLSFPSEPTLSPPPAETTPEKPEETTPEKPEGTTPAPIEPTKGFMGLGGFFTKLSAMGEPQTEPPVEPVAPVGEMPDEEPIPEQDTEETETAGELWIPVGFDPNQVDSEGKITVMGLTFQLTLPNLMNTLPTGTTDPQKPAMSIWRLNEKGEHIEVKSTDSLPLATPLFVRLFWADLENAKVQEYTLEALPDELLLPIGNGSLEAETNVPVTSTTTERKPYATLNWTQNSPILKVTFKDLGKYTPDATITNRLNLLKDAYMFYECSLDKAKLNADNQGKISFKLPGDATVSFVVNELKPVPPKLVKASATPDADGAVEWKVTYNHPVTAYAGDKPTTLVDTLPAELAFVTGSPKVTIDGVADNNANVGITPADTTASAPETLTYTLPATLTGGEVIELSYKTVLTESALTAIWNEDKKDDKVYSYQNSIEGLKDGKPISPVLKSSAKAEYNKDWDGFYMVAKVGEVDKGNPATDPTNPQTPWKTNWTVTVNTASRGFQHLHVIDTMGKGLTLDESSIKVNGSALTVGQLVKTTEADGKTKMVIKLVDNGSPTSAAAVYTVTYQTEIDPDYFNPTTSALTADDLSNEATLTYSWPAGIGLGTGDFAPPSITKNPGSLAITGNLVVKSAVPEYDPTTQALKWKVTLNPNQLNVTELVMEDNLLLPALVNQKGEEHSFIPKGADDTVKEAKRSAIETAIKTALTTAGVAENVLKSVSLDVDRANAKDTLRVVLGALGSNSLTFEFVTYAYDESIWAGNVVDKTFRNRATVLAQGTAVGGTAIQRDLSADANQKMSVNVLKKSSTAYDPATKMLTWTLTVNESKVPLGKVKITDTLPKGLSCIVADADATLGGIAFDGTNNTFASSVQADGRTKIAITLGTVTDKQEITFKTKVDVDNVDFLEEPENKYENTAVLTSDANGADTNSKPATATIKNSPLNKTVVTEKNSTKVTYTVKINPLGIDLLAGYPDATIRVKDTLPQGIYVDLDTVKLHDTTQKATGSPTYSVDLTKGNARTEDLDIQYDSKENSFSLNLPVTDKPLILTYDAHVVNLGVKLTNKVELIGGMVPETASNNDANNSFQLTYFAGASFSLPTGSFFSIQMKKVDLAGKVLTGAEFGLYASPTDPAPLLTATVDGNTGIAVLALPKRAIPANVTKLYVKEITAPAGYVLNGRWMEIDLATHDSALPVEMINVKEADKTAGKIVIQKVEMINGVETPRTGAKFQLYDDISLSDSSKIGTEVTVGNDGKATFTGLYPGATYYLKETEAPFGYSKLKKAIAVKSSATTTTPITKVMNEKISQGIKLTKVDALKPTEELAGGKFELYKEDKTTKLIEQTSNTDGLCIFELDLGEYWLKEVTAPTDYYLPTEVTAEILAYYPALSQTLTDWNDQWTKVTVKANTLEAVQVENIKKPMGIVVDKVDSQDNTVKLEGAVYGLYTAQIDSSKIAGVEMTTDKDGYAFLDFNDHQGLANPLAKGTYYLREEKAPEHYLLPEEVNQDVLDYHPATAVPDIWIEVVVTDNAVTRKTISNIKKPMGIDLTQMDAVDNIILLPDADYGLYTNNNDQSKIADVEMTTDKDGYTFFDFNYGFNKKMDAGTYYLKEEKAPVHYLLPSEVTTEVLQHYPKLNQTLTDWTNPWIEVEVEQDKVKSVEVESVKIPMGIDLTKMDSRKDLDGNDQLLEDAVFELYQADRITLIGKAKKTVDGYSFIDFNYGFTDVLPAGDYYLKELTVPTTDADQWSADFQLPSDPDLEYPEETTWIEQEDGTFKQVIGIWTKVLVEQDKLIPLTLENNRYPVGIEITKVDERNENRLLPDAVYELYASVEDPADPTQVIPDPDQLIGEFEPTHKDGKAFYDFYHLPEGQYFLKEKVSPKGYYKSNEYILVAVERNEITSALLGNKKIPNNDGDYSLPQTGDFYKPSQPTPSVVPPVSEDSSKVIPNTGVQDNISFWAIMMGFSFMTMVVAVIGIWKKRKAQ